MRQGQAIPGLFETVTSFEKGVLTCTVDCQVATGPWRTLETTSGSGVSARGGAPGQNRVFSEALETAKGTALFVTHDIQDLDVRIIAVDRDGKEHEPRSAGGAGVRGFHQLGAEFSLKRDAIREFRLQTRPYERLEIPDVALPLDLCP
jgi:hypothetical protein